MKGIEEKQIEAPYELPEGWKWCRLGEVCKTFSDGDWIESKDQSTEGIRLIQTGNIGKGAFRDKNDKCRYISENTFERLNCTEVFAGDILISRLPEPVGRACIIPQLKDRMITAVDCAIVRLFECTVEKKWFCFYTQSHVYDGLVKTSCTGTTRLRISRKNLGEIPIPLPPTLAEQQRIVNRIESMFAKLDEAKEKAQNVVDGFETRKAAILHKAFTGELTAKWRREKGVPDDSWKEKTLGEICSEIKIGPFGSLLHEDDYIENGIPLVNPKHISNQLIKPDTKVSISNEKAEELKSYRLLKNDIVLGRRGEMGRCAPVSENENGWLCGTGSMILRLKPEYQARIYSILISSHKSVLYFEENAVGTTLKNLNEKIVKNLPMPIISLPEQQEIVRILDTVLEKESRAKEAAQTVLDQITLLKKSILARAFRGEL